MGNLFQVRPGEAQAAKSDANGAAVREAYMNRATRVGRSSPLGVTIAEGGANFSLFSRSATGVELLFFDNEGDDRPSRVIPIDPAANRTYHYWHVFVPGVEPGQIYGYRVRGPFDPSRGMRFDPTKILLDPYGRGVVVPGNYSRDSACKQGENTATGMKSVVVDPRAYDWEKDMPLNRPWSKTIIYEMHVRGFTRHPSSNIPEEKRGTFAGLIEKIPYLQQLGMILDSLRHWVEEMHVDGFRFDLASILARDASGQVMPNPPVLWDIESDPALAGTKLIAEAWDAAGLYQVGSFIGDSWKEWNGRFRDDIRSFLRGEEQSEGGLPIDLSAVPRFTVTRSARPNRASTL
jgi:pullulanase/glycogen debranching enzyme